MFKNFLNSTSFMPTVCMSPDDGAGSGGSNDGGSNDGGQGDSSGGGTGGDGGAAPTIAWLPKASADDVTYVQSKGWDKANNPAEAILTSYRHLEKMNGALAGGKAVLLPDEGADEATFNQFYNKLGRPESADKYSEGNFSGMSEDLSKELKSVGHKLGLTEKQMAGIREWNNTATTNLQKNLEVQAAAEVAKQQDVLKKEWGAAYEQNVQVAKEVTAKMGWTEDQIAAMQMALGFDGVMKLAHNLGASLGESKFIGGDAGGRGGSDNIMTPSQASMELKRLSGDAEFMKAWQDKTHPKHQEMVNKKAQLSKWATGAK